MPNTSPIMKVEGFKYHGTNKAFYAYYKDGKWDEGKLDIHSF